MKTDGQCEHKNWITLDHAPNVAYNPYDVHCTDCGRDINLLEVNREKYMRREARADQMEAENAAMREALSKIKGHAKNIEEYMDEIVLKSTADYSRRQTIPR